MRNNNVVDRRIALSKARESQPNYHFESRPLSGSWEIDFGYVEDVYARLGLKTRTSKFVLWFNYVKEEASLSAQSTQE
jgi:hypothetical protein